MDTEFEKAVYFAVKKIPAGRISTYGAIAQAINNPKAARAVGNALNKNPYAPQVPCHRVVKNNGSLGGFAQGAAKKQALLRQEGVEVEKQRVKRFYQLKFVPN